jgi:transcriptional regulator with XRE-family HTH domain
VFDRGCRPDRVLAGFVIVLIGMTEIGRELAEARERAGLSVEELSHRTKISVPTLLAMERNQMGNLPGGIYARGLLRAYAKEVRLDPEAIVRRFRAEIGENADAIERLDRIAAAASESRVVERLHSADIDAADRRRAFRNTTIFLLVLLCGGSFYFAGDRITHWAAPLAHWAARSARPVAANVTESLTPPASAAPKPVGTTSAQPAPPTDHADGLRLEIQPRESCWLSATADGQRVIYRLLNAGERTLVEAKSAVDLRVGDAGAFAFTINGAAARAAGAAGQAVTIHLTPQNYREFLAPSQN